MITILSVAPIFSDHMVLQREKNTPVWGNGTDGRTVRLLFNGRSYEATVHNGKWCIVMPPFSAGTHGSIEINDGDTRLYYHDVVFGDVWFAGGQSNMELELQNSANGAQELANAAHHDIRFYQPLKQSFVDDAFIAAEKEGRWRVCGPDTAAALSAVA
jgi:sialate O-acetylesterase